MSLVESLEEYWLRYERRLEVIDGASADTLASYRHTFNLFKKFLADTGIYEISTQTIEEFLLWLHEQGYSKNSIKRHFYAIKSFLLYTPYAEEVQWRELRPRGEEKYDYNILSEDEVRRLIETGYSMSPKYGIMLWLGYEAATRVSELLSMRVRQVDLTRKAVLKYPRKRERPCEAPISEDLAVELAHWIADHKLNPDDYLFTTKFGRPWRREVFHKYVFIPVAERSGLLVKYPKLRFHDLRHSRATNLLRKGVDIYTVNKILCHKILQTTMIYLHIVQAEELRRRMEIVS